VTPGLERGVATTATAEALNRSAPAGGGSYKLGGIIVGMLLRPVAGAVSASLAAGVLLGCHGGAASETAAPPALNPAFIKQVDGADGVLADGRIALVDTYNSPTIFTTAGRSIRTVGPCDGGVAFDHHGISEMVIAGLQVVWVCVQDTISTHDRHVVSFRLGRKEGIPTLSDEYCSRTCLGNVAGGGSFVVYNTWRVGGEWKLWQAIGPARRLVASAPNLLGILAADSRGAFVARPGNRVELITPSGQTVNSFHLVARERVVLDGDLLATRTPHGVDVVAASDGHLLRGFALTKRASLEDLNRGRIVYAVGTTIHILRISTGKDVALPLPNAKAPVHAQLEDTGFFYTWHSPNPDDVSGYFAFVPHSRLARVLP
jgi:hypothetical protein